MVSSTRRAFLGSAAGSLLAQRQRRPNFIVLFADDMGWGNLGCYGHPMIRTPNLDRMAAEGARLTSYYAAASVCDSVARGPADGPLPDARETAEQFRAGFERRPIAE